MKVTFLIVIGCLSLFLSAYSFAGCSNGNCGVSGYARSCGSGGCQQSACGGGSEFDTTCECTDPSCYRTYDRTCLSKSSCCEAFGNVGAR